MSNLSQLITSEDPRKRAKAMEALYKRVFSKIRSFVLRNNGTKNDAEDIFQDGLVALYHNLCSGTFEHRSKVETYLFAICRNLWMQQLKKVKHTDDFLMDLQLTYEEDQVIRIIDTSLFKKVFEELKADCQRVLIDFYWHKISIKELRNTLNVTSDQAAKNKKSRCLKYLLQLIKDKNLTYSSFFE